MDKEEKMLHTRFGKTLPFKVPDGYFEDFQRQMMQQLPATKPAAKVVEMSHPHFSLGRRIAMAAAGVCVVVFGTALYHRLSLSEQHTSATVAQVEDKVYDTTIDQMADYTMMDNDDIYAYVSDN